MLAPIKARGGDDDPIYSYLDLLAATEADHELGRLLYVGATRARTRLHLIATAEIAEETTAGPRAWKPPRASSALAKLWRALQIPLPRPDTVARSNANATSFAPPRLRRFPGGFALPSLPTAAKMPGGALSALAPSAVAFEWAHATAAAIGTVTHRALMRFAADGIAQWNDTRVAALGPRIRSELRSEGVDDAQLAQAGADVLQALRSAIEDPRGRWLFDPAHEDAASERTLAGIDTDSIVHVSLDRTFVADGVRWIVDFKTGRHEGGDTAAFLAREEERYRPQLERYARIVRAIDARPIRLALYYPLVADGWREWAFAP
jgi:ATP-dependent exoDNAse (exonuclease V) beta subunit